MTKYIDYDTVLSDYDEALNYYKAESMIEDEDEFLRSFDFNSLVNELYVLNDTINSLLNSTDTADLVVRAKTLKEASAKLKRLNELGVKKHLTLIPGKSSLSEIAKPNKNILLSSNLRELDSWYVSGGAPIYYGDYHYLYPYTTNIQDCLDDNKCLKK